MCSIYACSATGPYMFRPQLSPFLRRPMENPSPYQPPVARLRIAGRSLPSGDYQPEIVEGVVQTLWTVIHRSNVGHIDPISVTRIDNAIAFFRATRPANISRLVLTVVLIISH